MARIKLLDTTESRFLVILLVSLLCLGSCSYQIQREFTDSPVSNKSVPPLVDATLRGDLKTVRQLLEEGNDPNGIYHTNTALTYAARDGFTEIARALIEYGAEVNWIDGEGVTPLILASFKGHLDMVQLLLEHGADTTVRDQWNQTALDYALRRGEADPIAQLLQ